MSELVKVETSELEGEALDWAVSKATDNDFWDVEKAEQYQPSCLWAHGGPLVEVHRCDVSPQKWGGWTAYFLLDGMDEAIQKQHGATYLIAAMRAIVASKLGDTVEVPKELVT